MEPSDWQAALADFGAKFGPWRGRTAILRFSDLEAEYEAMAASASVAYFSDRACIDLQGDDRAKFLNNLCTNDVKRLAVGQGCEAFLCDAKGHVLFHVAVFCREDALRLLGTSGSGARLAAHLDRYLIRERVEIIDRSASEARILVSGLRAAELLGSFAGKAVPSDMLSHFDFNVAAQTFWAGRVAMARPAAYVVQASVEDGAPLWRQLCQASGVPVGEETLEVARIEAGWPLYGVDITDKHLPQEVARSASAISFTKGCYLGQETVARIDALGHVNKTLARVAFDGPVAPSPGTELRDVQQPVGAVTSAVRSQRLDRAMAFAYLKRGHETAGTRLTSDFGDCTVLAQDD